MPGFDCLWFKEKKFDWYGKDKIVNCGVCLLFDYATSSCSAKKNLAIYKEVRMYCTVCEKDTAFITTTKGAMCKECKTTKEVDLPIVNEKDNPKVN